jgi:hypothetical protein
MPGGARILNAMLIPVKGGWIIKTTPATEVFWEPAAMQHKQS